MSLHIGATALTSRFLLGTAGYPSPETLRQAIAASGTQVLTLGLKRTLAAAGDKAAAWRRRPPRV